MLLNLPMRNLKTRLDSRGERVPCEPPQLAAPHPLPVTMAFIYEGLKRLRAVNAHSQAAAAMCALPPEEAAALDQAAAPGGAVEGVALDQVVVAGGGVDRLSVAAGAYTPSGLVPSGLAASARWRAALQRWRHLSRVPKALRELRWSVSSDDGKPETVLWRGMGSMRVTPRFMALGGTELACCSATSELDIAVRYSQKGGAALLFRIRSTTFVNLGCDISDLSAFPHEREFL